MPSNTYDCYGFKNTSESFRHVRLMPYKVDEQTDLTYVWFGDYDVGPIHRITKVGTVSTVEWAYGAVANRASLSYHPINETISVAVEG